MATLDVHYYITLIRWKRCIPQNRGNYQFGKKCRSGCHESTAPSRVRCAYHCKPLKVRTAYPTWYGFHLRGANQFA